MFKKCILLAVNPWAVHVSERKTVVEMIDHLVAKGILLKDPRQREMAALCEPLLRAVHEAHIRNSSTLLAIPSAEQDETNQRRLAILRRTAEFFTNLSIRMKLADAPSKAVDVQWPENVGRAPLSSGLYIWGDVGIGKTMILDLFELCPTPNFSKRRAHLHSFMTMISDRLHRVEEIQRSTLSNSGKKRRPIEIVVDEVVGETPVLCFDEFQTFDVAHAALLVAFFKLAFERGIFLKTTSNRHPSELFHLSSTFGDFLPCLYRHCNVVHCRDISDYRRTVAARGSFHHQVFLSPNTKDSAASIMAVLHLGLEPHLQQNVVAWEEDVSLPLYGRATLIPKRCGGVAVFDFSQICGNQQLLGPQDFQLIAQQFHTIAILNVPQIGTVAKNAAKQFIILVDELYQHKVKLLFTCSVPWERMFELADVSSGIVPMREDVYTDGQDERSSIYDEGQSQQSDEEVLSFGRLLSRLHEMGSSEYLTSDHVLFSITDFDTRAFITIQDDGNRN